MRIIFLAPVAMLAIACSAAPMEEEVADSSGEALSTSCSHSRASLLASASAGRRAVMERGFKWLDARVQYSQSRSYQGYRTDCSGFVSMCWGLDSSFTTSDFANGGGDSERISSYDDLLPGDALVRRSSGSGHVVLFLGWDDSSHRSACVLEQSSTRLDMQFGVRSASSLRSSGYKAIRADALSSDTRPSSPGDEDDDAAPGSDPDSDRDPAPAPAPPPSSGGATCSSDGQCNPGNDGSGLICEDRRCVPGCRSNAQCPGTSTCVAGQCN